MDDFETAIMISLDPTVTGELKENANRYCASVRTTPDAWKFCVDKIYKSNTMQVKFFCFQVLQDLILHRHASLSESDRANLKMFLINWMRDCNSTKQEDNAVKNKYAQLMALVVKTEYPDQWPTFFRDILGLLNGAAPPVVDLFLRIIKAVDDEVVSHELHRTPAEVAQTARIKDAMREGAIVDLVRVWYELLSHYKSSPPSLINTCLQTVKGYVGWIDIGLVVNEKFMGLLFQLLGIRSFAEESVECLYEIVCKGMEPYAKFNLLKQLNIKSIIAAAGANNDMEFLVKVGKLTNTMGVELLSCMDTVTSTSNGVPNGASSPAAEVDSMLNEMLALLFKTMNSESIEVSGSVTGFAQLYVNRLKTVKVTAAQIEHLQVFLQIIRNQAKYPTSFDFDDEDEEEKAFLDFRRELTTTYRNILRIIPERAIEFVGLTFNAVNVTPPSPFPDAEIALHLFYQIGEFYPSAAEPATGKVIEQFFTQTMVSLTTGPLSSHPHQSVTLAFFECVVRYAKYIPAPPASQPQYLVAVLSAFFDNRGLRHNQLVVRKRVAVLFLQFVRSVRGLLYPFLDSIINSLKELLSISFEVQKSVPFEEQLNFYEALGVLIGSNPDATAQQKHTEIIMQPVLAQLEEILAKELYKNDIASGKPYYTTLLSQTINVITTFSKGYVPAPKVGGNRSPSPSRAPNGKSHQQTPEPTQAAAPPSSAPPPSAPTALSPSRLIFAKSLDLVLRIPVVIPTHEDLRDKTYTFLHRMIEVLGQAIFPVLPSTLALLLTHSFYRLKDVQDFTSLTNQVTARFKETVFALINDMLMPFVRRMFELLNPATAPTPLSEEARELVELQKAYYAFLQQTLSNNLSNVFTSPTNAPHFPQILNTVVQGCVSKDLATQKVCVTILRRMAEEWGGAPSFNNLLFEQITPQLFTMAAGLDKTDAAMNALLGDVARVLKVIHSKTGETFINFLAQGYLPSIKCPADTAQQFVQHLDKTPLKQFTDIFKDFTRVFINLRTS